MDSQPPFDPSSSVCPGCGATIYRSDEVCPKCGHPLKVVQHDQQSSANEEIWVQAAIKALSVTVLRTVYTLYSLAGGFFIFAAVEYYADRDYPDIRSREFPVLLGAGIAFLLIGLLSRKKRLAAFVAGIVAFIIAVGFLYSYSGKGVDLEVILIVGIPLYVLITGTSAAAKLEKLNKK